MLIKIEQIVVKPGRREIDEKHVEELAKSIKSLSLLNPITVDQDYTLIAGLHRLEAVKLLGYSEIECNVTSLDGLRADLAELDENLIRQGGAAITKAKKTRAQNALLFYQSLLRMIQQRKQG